ncbi:MAG: membrane protein insertase YidC, partial [Desulfofustis sp.]|nr:membrane protein insertase YidC [Desulfofustis sp.]
MDMRRAFLAITLSFIILLGYQYLFVPPAPPPATPTAPTDQAVAPVAPSLSSEQPAAVADSAPLITPGAATERPAEPLRPAKEITVDTDLFTATISEQGGTFTSFVLKHYREELDEDSVGVDLLKSVSNQGLPLAFSWGNALARDNLYTLQTEKVEFDTATGKATIVLQAITPTGLEIVKRYIFVKDNYLIDHSVTVINRSGQVLQGMGTLHQQSLPFVKLTKAGNWLFRGPAYFNSTGLHEVKLKEFEDGPQTVSGDIDWVAYEDTYFMNGIVPASKPVSAIGMNAAGELVSIDLQSSLDTLAPNTEKEYRYQLFYGPKKLSLLKESGANLAKIVNFGWFDVIAKPMLYLLNWFYGLFSNYGVAIILVTVILKALFWPITQKGLKSMKNMQKLQPKMVKIKEKYKNDPTRMNQEMMNLYKTYKVNPLGGCLPMILQIPVFFALYKVLLQSIELRHAPFMLWINDLSAPDRLYLGFDLPYLGGLPVLTLLMGASLFLLQKL